MPDRSKLTMGEITNMRDRLRTAKGKINFPERASRLTLEDRVGYLSEALMEVIRILDRLLE